jgi:hypothetical protein
MNQALLRSFFSSCHAAVFLTLCAASSISARADEKAGNTAQFDGVWQTTLSCANSNGALGYSFRFASTACGHCVRLPPCSSIFGRPRRRSSGRGTALHRDLHSRESFRPDAARRGYAEGIRSELCAAVIRRRPRDNAQPVAHASTICGSAVREASEPLLNPARSTRSNIHQARARPFRDPGQNDPPVSSRGRGPFAPFIPRSWRRAL